MGVEQKRGEGHKDFKKVHQGVGTLKKWGGGVLEPPYEPCLNSIPTRILKLFKNDISGQLADIFNISFSTCILPLGDIQLLCYHKMITIQTFLPLVCTFLILVTTPTTCKCSKLYISPPPIPYKNSKLYDFIIS